MLFKLIFVVAPLALGNKKKSSGLLHGTHCNRLIKMRHTCPISQFKCNPSFHRKQTP